jgi:hypothetical protein
MPLYVTFRLILSVVAILQCCTVGTSAMDTRREKGVSKAYGMWDAAGKVFKEFMRKLESTKMSRFANNAFDCFDKCRHALDTPKLAKPWVSRSGRLWSPSASLDTVWDRRQD